MTWHTLAQHGIAVRGPAPDQLDIHSDPAELRAWTRANLDDYWRRWVMRARQPGPAARGLIGSRRFTAAGVLGVSRLHYTLATGEIVSKEAAHEYALRIFAPEWHPVIEYALAFWRGARSRRGAAGRGAVQAADFVSHVIDMSLGPRPRSS